jgi:hypothetical protein
MNGYAGHSMSRLFLLISKPQRGSGPLHVTCAFSGDIDGLRAVDRKFPRPSDLEKELQCAGVFHYEKQTPAQVFSTGMHTFIPVSIEVAKKLGVLE